MNSEQLALEADWADSGEVVCADCLEHMRTMPDCSVDAIVTDPPYGLSFMGAEWDSYGGSTGRQTVAFQESMTPIFAEALRVAKPGAHLLCFGGTRTFHRMTCAIEDAGWEIRDCIMWVYGSGFPKSMDVGKAIDKALGARREKVPNQNNAKPNAQDTGRYGAYGPTTYIEPEPATDAGRRWDGWGTSLKPAWESVIVAQKVPNEKTVMHHLKKVEECLCKSYAKTVANPSVRTQARYEEGTDDSARGSVQTRAEGSRVPTIQTGKAVDTGSRADTSESVSEAVDIALNMISLWKSTLEEACELVSRCTTEMATSLTTDLRTWSCFLLQTTPESIITVATPPSGSNVPVSDVERLFFVVREKLSAIRILTAPASATWDNDIRPAWEPIIVARKPLDGTVAHNVMEYGTGAINIDGCRVPIEAGDDVFAKNPHTRSKGKDSGIYGTYNAAEADWSGEKGRFPANLIHDGSDEVLALFPESNQGKPGITVHKTGGERHTFDAFNNQDGVVTYRPAGNGSAARFFYCAKASKRERGQGNGHPTVKPIALMEWLVRLVTRERQVVLDPFAGSGTTLVACKSLGRRFVGIEREPEYVEIVKRRLGQL